VAFRNPAGRGSIWKSIVYRIFRAKSEVKIFCVNGFRPIRPSNTTKTSVSILVGSDTGTRYRILRGTTMNIAEFAANGRVTRRWCFAPEGALATGDVMLGRQYLAIMTGLSRVSKLRITLTPELRDIRNQTMLFVFGL